MGRSVLVLLIVTILVRSSLQIIGGRNAAPGEVPSQAAVFREEDDEMKFYCGGTVISSKFVLTAHFCVLDDRYRVISSASILVKMGIINIEIPSQKNVQTCTVKNIFNYDNDTLIQKIALLELNSEVRFNEYVQPAYLGLDGDLTGKIGIVSGWGLTAETSYTRSTVLKVANMPVNSDETCIESNEQFRHYLGDYVFCAGLLNGTGICPGDGGSGLLFRKGQKMFLGGMASFSIQKYTGNPCSAHEFGGYTRISTFLTWVREITNLDITPPDAEECGIPRNGINHLIVAGEPVNSVDFPWHATIYHRLERSKPQEYACGGSLIHRKFIVTALHCTINPVTKTLLTNKVLIVRLGVQELYMWRKELQEYTIYNIHRPRNSKFRGLKNDIAILELYSEVDFTDHVIPICLPTRDVTPTEEGTVVGFGLTEDFELSQHLKMASLPVIEDLRCTRSDPGWGIKLDEGLFCSGRANGTTVCNGDSGGGLAFLRDGTWELGGLVSFALSNSSNNHRCRIDQYGAFTRVYKYLPWITQILESI